VVCLYSEPQANGFGARQWHDGCSHWHFRAPDFADNLFRALEEDVIPTTGRITTGQFFAGCCPEFFALSSLAERRPAGAQAVALFAW